MNWNWACWIGRAFVGSRTICFNWEREFQNSFCHSKKKNFKSCCSAKNYDDTTKNFFCQKVWIQLRCSSIEILLESEFTWFKFSGEKKSSLFMPESEDVFTHFRHSMRDLVSLKIRDSSHSWITQRELRRRKLRTFFPGKTRDLKMRSTSGNSNFFYSLSFSEKISPFESLASSAKEFNWQN